MKFRARNRLRIQLIWSEYVNPPQSVHVQVSRSYSLNTTLGRGAQSTNVISKVRKRATYRLFVGVERRTQLLRKAALPRRQSSPCGE